MMATKPRVTFPDAPDANPLIPRPALVTGRGPTYSCHVYRFASSTAAAAVLRERLAVGVAAEGWANIAHSSMPDRSGFYNCTPENGAMMGVSGWVDGAKKARDTAKKLIAGAHNVFGESSRQVWGESGNWVDVGRVLDGDPEPMALRRDALARSGRTVTILVNIGASHNVDGEVMARKAAAISAMCAAAESRGLRVGLLAFSNNGKYPSSKETSCFVVPVKKPGDPMNLARLAFWAGHPSALRRHIFAMREALGSETFYRRHGDSYGCSREIPEGVAEFLGVKPENIISGGTSDFWSDKSTIDWLKRECAAIGIKL